MKIYELIYYYEDIVDGADITDTKIVTSIKEVNEALKEFNNISLEDEYISKNTTDFFDGNHDQICYYEYDGGSSNLLIKIHDIKIKEYDSRANYFKNKQ